MVQAQKLWTGTRYGLEILISVAKALKLKVRTFWGLIPTFAEVTEESLVRGAFLPHPLLNRVNPIISSRLLVTLGIGMNKKHF